jgi:glycosyltransferase involved in cell wall biosynthesis
VQNAELWLVSPETASGAGVRSHGSIAADALADLYRRAWVVCVPSSYEGFGRPAIEAMASGTPVVATPHAGAREVLDGGRFGLIAEDRRLGAALCSVLTDARLREELARLAVSRAREYAWDRVAARYERIYSTLAEPAASPAPTAAGGRASHGT